MKPIPLLILLAALAEPFQAAHSAGIPARPEKLSFPPLKFDAPVPDQYRVTLASGPVAYLVPDR